MSRTLVDTHSLAFSLARTVCDTGPSTFGEAITVITLSVEKTGAHEPPNFGHSWKNQRENLNFSESSPI